MSTLDNANDAAGAAVEQQQSIEEEAGHANFKTSLHEQLSNPVICANAPTESGATGDLVLSSGQHKDDGRDNEIKDVLDEIRTNEPAQPPTHNGESVLGNSVRPEDAPQEFLNAALPPEESQTVPSQEQCINDRQNSDSTVGNAVSSKVSRVREEETESSPEAKKVKLDASETLPDDTVKADKTEASPDETHKDKLEESPQEALPEGPKPEPKAMTRLQQKHVQKAISNVKRLTPARHFVAPVDFLKLNLPQYPILIKQPMDLRTLDEKFKAGNYHSVGDCVADFDLIISNALAFNGATHPVAIDATKMKASFDRYLADLPPSDALKISSSKDALGLGSSPHNKTVSSSGLTMADNLKNTGGAGSPRAFALDPDGLPMIRRESTADGRPKREIHRPPPRDLPYSAQKPRKKKYQWELRFCDHVLKELAKAKYSHLSFPFMQPVDPVALNIPNYLSVVKTPMDFGTIRQKLDHGEYESAKDFDVDARQVFKNCYAFNPAGHDVNVLGHKFEAVYQDVWGGKRDWLAENKPSHGHRSSEGSPVFDSDGFEHYVDENSDNEPEDQRDQLEIVSKLQKQIAEMSRQVEMITNTNKKRKSHTSGTKVSSKSSAKSSRSALKKTAPQSSAKDKGLQLHRSLKKEKIPQVTYEQKQDISNRINSLSEGKMTQALTIIRNDMPSLKGVQEDELELDIDELSNDVLYKLLVFVRRHAPRAGDSDGNRVSRVAVDSTGSSRRKNQLSKSEQDARIAQLQSGLSAFHDGQGESTGPDYDEHVHPSIERKDEDDDSEDDSESEED